MARYTEKEKKARAKKPKSNKVAQLKDLGGVLVNPSMEKTLKKLGISPADLLKIQSSGISPRQTKFGPVKL